jgi:hypothetical protein
MNVHELIFKWSKAALTERSAAHQHFLDLCAVVGHPTPAEVDPEGDSFTFEKGVAKYGGGRGWADVWKRGFFGWEYKRQGQDLAAAYGQLLLYREALENPPLLVVCDMDRIVIHTNFTGRPTVVHDLALRELEKPGKAQGESRGRPLRRHPGRPRPAGRHLQTRGPPRGAAVQAPALHPLRGPAGPGRQPGAGARRARPRRHPRPLPQAPAGHPGLRPAGACRLPAPMNVHELIERAAEA